MQSFTKAQFWASSWMLIQGQGRSKSWILSLAAAHWAQCCLQFSQFSQLCNPHNSHHLPTPTSPKWIKLWIWVSVPFSPWQMSTELKQHLKSIWKLNTRFKPDSNTKIYNLQTLRTWSPVEVINWTTRWCHLHKMHIWPASGATCISCKLQKSLESYANLATRRRHLL